MLNILKKKDPICGMRQEKNKGFIDKSTSTWLCSEACKKEFEKRKEKAIKSVGKASCCK